jgi:hypothetical protein
MAVNYSFGQAFTKAEKEVFYKDYMQELNSNPGMSTEVKEDMVFCYLQELEKMDRRVYENMIDFEKRKWIEKVKSYCSHIDPVIDKTQPTKFSERTIEKLDSIYKEQEKARSLKK